MSLEAIATRYANALYEIGKEEGDLPGLVSQVQSVGNLYAQSKELQRVLDNPLVEESARGQLLADLSQRLELGVTMTNTLRLLAARHRLVLLPLITRMMQRRVDTETRLVRGSVTSATLLTDAYRKQLTAELERAMGQQVVLEFRVDPSLLGGLVTRMGDKVLDGSVRAQLARMKQALLAS